MNHVPPTMTRYPNDLEATSKLFSQDKKAVLQVIDAPYDGTTPQPRAMFSFSDDIAEGMKSLPSHDSNTARILDVTTHFDFIIIGLRDTKDSKTTRLIRNVLIKFLQDTYSQPFEERRIFKWLSDPLLMNNIDSISSQWIQRLGGNNANFYCFVNRTSLQQDFLDYDLHSRNSYLTCEQDANSRLISMSDWLSCLLLLTSLQPSLWTMSDLIKHFTSTNLSTIIFISKIHAVFQVYWLRLIKPPSRTSSSTLLSNS